MIIVVVPLFLFGVILFFWQLSNIISIFYGCPYVMMDKKVIREALKLAGLKKGDVFYDLGCGRGDVLIEAAKIGAKCTGIEISPYYYIYAKLRLFFILSLLPKNRSSENWGVNNKRKIEIKMQNILSVDLSNVDVVYCYLLPKFLKKLTSKFNKEMKPGSRLISVGFPITELKNEKKYNIENRKLYIYKF